VGFGESEELGEQDGVPCSSALGPAGSEEAGLPVGVIQRSEAHSQARAAVGERPIPHVNSHMDGRQGVEVTEEDDVTRLERGDAHGLA
jgi:methylmalonyl-CoA mutase N-terminal domain/subunit